MGRDIFRSTLAIHLKHGGFAKKKVDLGELVCNFGIGIVGRILQIQLQHGNEARIILGKAVEGVL